MPHALTPTHVKRLESILAKGDFASDRAWQLDYSIVDSLYPLALADPPCSLKRMTKSQAAYYSIWTMEAEVSNGGFLQFFDNQGPTVVRCALRALNRSSLRPVHAILVEAVRALPGGRLPRSRERLQEITSTHLTRLERRLSRLNQKFYDLTSEHLHNIPMLEFRLRLAAQYRTEFFYAVRRRTPAPRR